MVEDDFILVLKICNGKGAYKSLKYIITMNKPNNNIPFFLPQKCMTKDGVLYVVLFTPSLGINKCLTYTIIFTAQIF